MPVPPPSSKHPARAFTLLEMMLSIAVFLLLAVSAFSLVGATTELMTEISETQNQSALRLRFMESCRAAFESTTSDSTIEFEYFDRGSDQYDFYLALVKAPNAFDFGLNTQDQITRVVLASEARPDGFSRVGVYYLTDSEFENVKTSGYRESDAPYVELISRVNQLRWRFYDNNREEWVESLDGNVESSLVEMTLQIEPNAPTLRSVFYW